jgi:hypothetical protein
MANNDNLNMLMREIDKWMDKQIDEIFRESQENLVRDGKIDTSTLLKSGNINREFLDKEIVYTAVHSVPVEFGRAEGSMPPVKPIQVWARRKLGIPEKEANSVGWAIAKSIEKRGIAPSPYLRPAVKTIMGVTL